MRELKDAIREFDEDVIHGTPPSLWACRQARIALKAVSELLSMAEIDTYIFKVHNKGKYSVEAKNGYNECIRDVKRIINSHEEIK